MVTGPFPGFSLTPLHKHTQEQRHKHRIFLLSAAHSLELGSCRYQSDLRLVEPHSTPCTKPTKPMHASCTVCTDLSAGLDVTEVKGPHGVVGGDAVLGGVGRDPGVLHAGEHVVVLVLVPVGPKEDNKDERTFVDVLKFSNSR